MNDPLFPVANFWNPIARCPYFPLGSRRSIVTQVGRSDVLMKTNGNMTGNPNRHLVPPLLAAVDESLSHFLCRWGWPESLGRHSCL